jgi:flagellar biosynthesis/type III secretory pathway protein FliH
MALIKQSNARDIARDAIVLDLGDLQRQATTIVAGARTQAASIAAQAKSERERILAGAAETGRAEGFESGRKQGHQAGLAEGRAAAIGELKERLAKLEASWNAALASFQADRDDMLRHSQRDVLRLALGVAERVTKRVVQADPQVVVSQLEALLAVIVRPTELTVRIHPDDRELLGAALPQLGARFSQARHIELVDDAALTRGSCVASTRAASSGAVGTGGANGLSPGEIDASIQTQLDRIVEALLPGQTQTPAPDSPSDG